MDGSKHSSSEMRQASFFLDGSLDIARQFECYLGLYNYLDQRMAYSFSFFSEAGLASTPQRKEIFAGHQ